MIRVGEYHIGVRTSTPAVHEAVESSLREHLVDDPDARASFAIYEAPTTLTASRPLYHVYWNCNNLFATPSVSRAIAVLTGFIDELLPESPATAGLLRLEATALVGQHGAMLTPWSLPYRSPSVEVALTRHGIQLLERTSVYVDDERRQLIVPPIRISSQAIGEGNEAGWEDPSAATTASGTHPLVGWIFETRRGAVAHLSRAEAVARGMRVTHLRETSASNLRRLAVLVRGLQHLHLATPAATRQLAREILDGHPLR